MFKHPVVALAIISTPASGAAFAGDPINLQGVPLMRGQATLHRANRMRRLPDGRAVPIQAEVIRATAR